MHLYGDESGHIRSLLDGTDSVVVIAVVAGNKNACMGCPKRTVSRRNELSEAKWSKLETTEKRRFIECFSDNRSNITYGYISLSRIDLVGMRASYLLHDNENFEYDRDVSIMAWCYAELITQMAGGDRTPAQMTFDKFFHASQSDDLEYLLSKRTNDNVTIEYGSSHAYKGIQAADCLAGAVSECERNRGYVDKDAWKPRDGQPYNKYRFPEHERQNFFGNGAGVMGGSTLANLRDNSTLFYYHQNQNESGWNNSCLALFESTHSARGVAYPVDIHSEGSKGFINDVVVKGFYVGWRVGITIRGNETVRKNRFEMDMQPEDGVSEHMMVYDNTTAQRNLFRGCSWDPAKASGPMWLIKRATGQNVLQSLTGHGNGILEDRTGGSNTVTNPF